MSEKPDKPKKPPRRPLDPNELAKSIVDEATEENREDEPSDTDRGDATSPATSRW